MEHLWAYHRALAQIVASMASATQKRKLVYVASFTWGCDYRQRTRLSLFFHVVLE